MQLSNEKQGTNLQVTEGLTVSVYPDSKHEFTMPTKEVAKGYGASEYSIRMAKKRNRNELIEGKHFISNVTISHGAKPGATRGTMWTKRGIVRLGFFIKSPRARMFRDWAEDLIIETAFQQTERKLKGRFHPSEDYKQLHDAVSNAVMACGSQAALARRLGIEESTLSLIRNRPWLVSDDRQRAIYTGCRNVLKRNGQVDIEAIRQLMLIDDREVRVSLYEKMQKGGLL
jgi:DNA-binding transcriptional regulator YdaS (Cro superfamily)